MTLIKITEKTPPSYRGAHHAGPRDEKVGNSRGHVEGNLGAKLVQLRRNDPQIGQVLKQGLEHNGQQGFPLFHNFCTGDGL